MLKRGNLSTTSTVGFLHATGWFLGSREYGSYLNFAVVDTTATEYNLTMPISPLFDSGTWHHIAITRNNNMLRLFFDGVLQDSKAITTSFQAPVLPLIINAIWNGSTYANFANNAYYDELRITNGVARYTANFTPPTNPFPDDGD